MLLSKDGRKLHRFEDGNGFRWLAIKAVPYKDLRTCHWCLKVPSSIIPRTPSDHVMMKHSIRSLYVSLYVHDFSSATNGGFLQPQSLAQYDVQLSFTCRFVKLRATCAKV
jgi:hypothetical protein